MFVSLTPDKTFIQSKPQYNLLGYYWILIYSLNKYLTEEGSTTHMSKATNHALIIIIATGDSPLKCNYCALCSPVEARWTANSNHLQQRCSNAFCCPQCHSSAPKNYHQTPYGLSIGWWMPVFNTIGFPDRDPTGFCNSEPDPDWTGSRKNRYRNGYGYQNCVDHCSRMLNQRFFSDENRMGSNIWMVQPDYDRTGFHNVDIGLD